MALTWDIPRQTPCQHTKRTLNPLKRAYKEALLLQDKVLSCSPISLRTKSQFCCKNARAFISFLKTYSHDLSLLSL
uniref:Uncharacterized protein n=1 Tax=Anguilla anguilla TaxID=7936 RepID=A0A0E9PII2_ANGAN